MNTVPKPLEGADARELPQPVKPASAATTTNAVATDLASGTAFQLMQWDSVTLPRPRTRGTAFSRQPFS